MLGKVIDEEIPGWKHTTPGGIGNVATSDATKMNEKGAGLKESFASKSLWQEVSSFTRESPYDPHVCKRCENGLNLGLLTASQQCCYCILLLPLLAGRF